MENLRIDAHQHFWKYNKETHPWITQKMDVIQRDFLPKHLLPELEKCQIHGCVAVQASQSLEETNFLLHLAKENTFIKGVVGWVDLQNPNLELALNSFKKEAHLKGFRHILHDEPDLAFMLQKDFLNGIKTILKEGYTYDILIHSKHLQNTTKFLETCGEGKLIIDHIAKPNILEKEWEPWTSQMKEIAHKFPNVHVKLSGLVTEASWKNWTKEEIFPYMENILEAFGPKRMLYGSDWPVCTLAADYFTTYSLVHQFIQTLSKEEQAAILGGNAVAFYSIA